MNNTRAYSQLEIKSYDDEERVIRGWATTPEPDRSGDIVDPMGAQFKNPMPLLWQHRHDQPIGSVEFGKATRDGIPFTAKLPKLRDDSPLKSRVEDAWACVREGIIRTVSIGFRVLQDGMELLPTGGVKFTNVEVYELSLVSVPANANATITEIKAYDKGLLTAATGTGEQEPEPKAVTPARAMGTKTTVVTIARAKGTKMSKYADKLKGYQDALAAKKAERMETVEKSLNEGRTADAAEQETIDTLGGEIKELEKQVALIKSLIDEDKATAAAIDGTTEQKGIESRRATVAAVPVHHAAHAEKGLAVAQLARLQYQSGGNAFSMMQIAESQKQSLDPRVVAHVKAAVPAANTGVPTWAGNLVTQGGLMGDFVEFLRPATILGRFGNDGIPSLRDVPFNIPLLGQTSGGEGYWVGEGKAKPLTQWAYGSNMLQPLKVANIAVITEELLKRATPQADRMIRDELVRALVARLDIDFINPAKAAVAGVSPASITNGVVAVPSLGSTPDAIRADVAAVLGAYVTANNSPTSGVWIMGSMLALQLSMLQAPLGNGKEFPGLGMTGGEFLGFRVIVSEHVPAETVVFVNAQDVYFGDEGGFDLAFSREASLEMADNPAHNSTTPTGAASMVSMFQTNSVAFRAERHLNWAKRRPGAVQVLSGVEWGKYTPPAP
jgi:HK97 family phage prohead protease